MTTPTTPYALWQHVPLSECRGLWITYDKPRRRRRPAYRVRWLSHIVERYVERLIDQLADVTAERDQILDHLDGTIEAHKDDIRRYNEMAAQLAAVTAERDALRRELDAMTGEL